MKDNRDIFSKVLPSIFRLLKARKGEGKGLLERLGPMPALSLPMIIRLSFCPGWYAAAAEDLKVKLEVVDSNGLAPSEGSGPGLYHGVFV